MDSKSVRNTVLTVTGVAAVLVAALAGDVVRHYRQDKLRSLCVSTRVRLVCAVDQWAALKGLPEGSPVDMDTLHRAWSFYSHGEVLTEDLLRCPAGERYVLSNLVVGGPFYYERIPCPLHN
jgi:hypothetical protein